MGDSALYKQLRDAMRLVIFETDEKYDAVDVRQSLINRYPVYYGDAMPTMYDPAKVSSLMGYTPDDSINPLLKYAVAGPAWMRNMQKIWLVHTWGVNLEDEDTDDYKHFVYGAKDSETKYGAKDSASKHPKKHPKAGRLKRKRYRRAVHRMIKGIFEAVLSSEYPGDIIVNIPLMGLGAYLRALERDEDCEFCRSSFFIELTKAMTVPRYKNKIWLRVAIYDHYQSAETRKLSQLSQVMVETQADLFHLPIASKMGLTTQVFHQTNFGHQTKYKVRAPHRRQHSEVPPLQCLVNAWDSRSWIGNGGSKDHTIDGMMVSSTGDGSKLPNTSYLHNCFFVPTVLQESHWIRLVAPARSVPSSQNATPETSVSLEA